MTPEVLKQRIDRAAKVDQKIEELYLNAHKFTLPQLPRYSLNEHYLVKWISCGYGLMAER